MKPVELAKLAINEYIINDKIVVPPKELENVQIDRAATFVSIHLKDGELRGCIGTTIPTRKNISEEIVYNAIAASTQDPRFPAIAEDELDNLAISVDILMHAVPVKSTDELDPKRYGIIIESKNGRKALLLPDLEGVDTVDYQIQICRYKAGISDAEPIKIKKFEVIRYHQ